MKTELRCIMLVDDDQNDNFFHEREIKKTDLSITVITKNSGLDALDYLKSMKKNKNIQPVLIFLDINMPCMNGWEFLKEYSRLDKEIQSEVMIVMLTTSVDPQDLTRAKEWSIVSDYITKPLTKELLENIIKKYFKN
jgi:CheY-like chemotaxis protein